MEVGKPSKADEPHKPINPDLKTPTPNPKPLSPEAPTPPPPPHHHPHPLIQTRTPRPPPLNPTPPPPPPPQPPKKERRKQAMNLLQADRLHALLPDVALWPLIGWRVWGLGSRVLGGLGAEGY